MVYFIASVIVVSLFLTAMAIGVIMGRAPLKGSCGGLGKLMGKDCEFCENKDKCVKNNPS